MYVLTNLKTKKMKKLLFPLIVILVIISSSCSSNDDDIDYEEENNTTSIVGTWKSVTTEDGYSYTEVLTFKNNNTFTDVIILSFEGEQEEFQLNGTYTTSGDSLTIIVTEEGEQETVYLTFSLNKNKLTIKEIDDETEVVVYTKQ